MATEFYARVINSVDRQNVTLEDGVIINQELVARSGYYEGDGNPELVGQSKKALRGKGFKKVAGPQYFNATTEKWQSATPSYDLVEGDYNDED